MELEKKVKELRALVFKTICNGGGGHIPASLSLVDILAVLYYRILKVDPKNYKAVDRDRFVLSKGHGGVALYAILADLDFFDRKHLETFGKKGAILGGHPDMHKVPGIEASTGTLGHGLSFGCGVALAGKLNKKDYRVFVVIGDGECQEGSIWEAALFAPQKQLDNLTVIVDYNKLQAMDFLDNIIKMDPFVDKWKAFGWKVKEVDGHNMDELFLVFDSLPLEKNKPSLIVAHTTKGKGVSFMENTPIWHYRMPNPQEMKIACCELGLEYEDGVIK